jgi:hypothetical protein
MGSHAERTARREEFHISRTPVAINGGDEPLYILGREESRGMIVAIMDMPHFIALCIPQVDRIDTDSLLESNHPDAHVCR